MTTNLIYKKALTILLSLCLIFTLNGISHAQTTGQTASDIKGHWAESQLNSWLDQGFIKGYPDGNVKPDNSITRAEFMALVNNSFGFTEKTDINYTDVKTSDWFYNQVAIATKAGYIKGYTDGTVGSNKPISRQEVAVVVNNLLSLQATGNEIVSFVDVGEISAWSKDSIGALFARNIMQGNPQNMFEPLNPITRAEAVVTLNRAIQDKTGNYNTAGAYGVKSGTETFTGNVSINVQGVTLQNMIITGNLLLGKGIESGDATLKNVTVKGTTTVNGGGVNSIHVNDSTLSEVVIDKQGSKVRIVAEGSTTVNNVTVNTPVTIEESGTTGSGFGNVTLSDKLPIGSDITLNGSFENLKVSGKGINIDIPVGSVNSVTVDTNATGVNLNLNESVKVAKLEINAALNVTGSGTIQTVDAKVDGSTFTTTPLTTPTPSSVTPTPTPVSTIPSLNGGGNGGGGYIPTPTPTITPSPTPTVTPVPTAPIITNVNIASNNVDSTKAMNGDIITLTFTADEAVTKLGNFKINGSNPDTFTNVGNVYTATHLVDVGDLVTGNPATFQINVQNAAGLFSITTEATTDGSSVTVLTLADPETLLSNPSLTVYSENLNKPWEYPVGHTYQPNTTFQVNVNFNGVTVSDFVSAEVNLYDGNTLLATDKAKPALLAGNYAGLSDVFGMGDTPATNDTNWIIGGYPSDKKPTRVEFKLIDKHNTLHIVQALMTPIPAVQPETLLANPTITVYDPTNTIFQTNVNFASGTSSDFKSAQISLYHDTTLLATNTAKQILLDSHAAGLTDLFGIGDTANTVADPNWNIGAYSPNLAPTRVVFTLVGNDNVVHIIEAIFTP